MIRHRHAPGWILLSSLIVLSLLSLIAFFALRHLTLNLRASGAYSAQLAAFAASENARAQLPALLQAHVATRGWPRRFGGEIEDAEFAEVSASLSLAGSAQRNWFAANSESASSFTPLALDIDARYTQDASSAQLAVYRLRAVSLPDGNAGFAQGYEGAGAGLAAGGGALIFYLHSEGRGPDQAASAITGAIYRQQLQP